MTIINWDKELVDNSVQYKATVNGIDFRIYKEKGRFQVELNGEYTLGLGFGYDTLEKAKQQVTDGFDNVIRFFYRWNFPDMPNATLEEVRQASKGWTMFSKIVAIGCVSVNWYQITGSKSKRVCFQEDLKKNCYWGYDCIGNRSMQSDTLAESLVK